MFSLRILFIGGLAIAATAVFLRVDYLETKVDSQKQELQNAAQYITDVNAAIEKAKNDLRIAEQNRAEYFTKLSDAEHEIKNLRNAVSSGAVKLRVKATCQSLPTTATDTTRDTEAAPRLTEDAKQAYFDLLSELQQCPAQLALAIKTMRGERDNEF